MSPGQRLCDVAAMSSEFDTCEVVNSDSSRKPLQRNQSSGSGFSKAEIASATVRQTLSTDEVKYELPDIEAPCETQSSFCVANQVFDVAPSDSSLQQKTGETSIPSVKSWAALLTSGKNSRHPSSALAVSGSRSDQPKLSKSFSAKNTSVIRTSELKSVTRSRVNKSASRSATRDDDRTQFISSDGCRDGAKARDRKTKSRSQTPQTPGDASAHIADSRTAVKPKQDERGGDDGSIDATASNFQSKASKQKKKKKNKKKLKGSEVAEEKTSDVVERREAVLTYPAPEFDNLNEFPSLFSLSTGSRKTPLQASIAHSTASAAHLTSGIYNF